MRSLLFTQSAQDDLADIAFFIADESGSREVAEEFTSQIREKCAYMVGLGGTLGTARPELGNALRSLPFKNYVIFFRYRDQRIEIVNVLHGSRDVEAHLIAEMQGPQKKGQSAPTGTPELPVSVPGTQNS